MKDKKKDKETWIMGTRYRDRKDPGKILIYGVLGVIGIACLIIGLIGLIFSTAFGIIMLIIGGALTYFGFKKASKIKVG